MQIYLTKLQVQKQFLAFIIVKTIIIIFYKVTYNTKLTFNLAITNLFEFFLAKILAFLFAMIYYGIREYQSRVKVIKPFDIKTA